MHAVWRFPLFLHRFSLFKDLLRLVLLLLCVVAKVLAWAHSPAEGNIFADLLKFQLKYQHVSNKA